jgi:hypothetical protein
MASYGCDTDDDGARRSKLSAVMGSETREAQCTTLYVCDSTNENCSQRLRSILGVLPCSLPRIWRLWARTKNEYTMDDFSTLTIREPWLLKRNFTSRASAWLAGRDRCYQVIVIGGMRPNQRGFPQDHYQERKANLRSAIVSCTDNDFMRKVRNRLAHTFTYLAILGFWQLIVLKVQYFSKLMQCICLCSMVLMMHVRMTWLPIWWVSDCKGNRGQEGSEWRVAFS